MDLDAKSALPFRRSIKCIFSIFTIGHALLPTTNKIHFLCVKQKLIAPTLRRLPELFSFFGHLLSNNLLISFFITFRILENILQLEKTDKKIWNKGRCYEGLNIFCNFTGRNVIFNFNYFRTNFYCWCKSADLYWGYVHCTSKHNKQFMHTICLRLRCDLLDHLNQVTFSSLSFNLSHTAQFRFWFYSSACVNRCPSE